MDLQGKEPEKTHHKPGDTTNPPENDNESDMQ